MPHVRYLLERKLGIGGMSVVYEAKRRTPQGETPTVVKLMLPKFVQESQQIALTSLSKEAQALQRLNDRVPPTPFVVRFYDVGFLEVQLGGGRLSLPWLSLEFVEGGDPGTTLTERVEHARRALGHAFNMSRAQRAIDNICQGTEAVHEVGVIHRDLKPDNILCCGFGDDEIFKITDFGISRSAGMKATFLGFPVGTPGYVPVEQADPNNPQIGPWTDVFALGAIAYFLLTGEDLFPATNLYAAIAAAQLPTRRSIRESRWLDPELRASSWRCDRIDEVIARATAAKPQDRPRSAQELGTLFQACLGETGVSRAFLRKFHESALHRGSHIYPGGSLERSWVIRQAPGQIEEVRHVAWNSDGTALVATSEGLSYWTGTTWQRIPLEGYPNPKGLRFVRSLAPNQWLLGGDRATLASFTSKGLGMVVQGTNVDMTLTHASGNINDLAVVVATAPGQPPMLFGIASRRWMRQVPLPDVASVNGVEQLDDTAWLVVGRTDEGDGFALVYEPLQWELTPVRLPQVRAMLSCATIPVLGLGVAVGTEGTVVVLEERETRLEILGDRPDLVAVAVDQTRMAWASSRGRIYNCELVPGGAWRCAWVDPAWTSPLISLHASPNVVRAMSLDGGILEGIVRSR
ncbi:MAG: serine/threonine protein kinase [Polyangiaceae bacterium]|nr:serine/threonine protein kinase [Polyangiaceae bacterium]